MTGRTNAGGGIQLPALTNPAAAGNIQSGYQAINGEGEVVTGTAAVKTFVNGTISLNSNMGGPYVICYVTDSGPVYDDTSNTSYSGPIEADSLLTIYDDSTYGSFTASGGLQRIGYDFNAWYYSVKGNFSIQTDE